MCLYIKMNNIKIYVGKRNLLIETTCILFIFRIVQIVAKVLRIELLRKALWRAVSPVARNAGARSMRSAA